MSNCIVYAVMTATVEVCVRSSGGGETLDQLHDAAQKEAEGILRNNIKTESIRIMGKPEFSHVIVRAK